MRQMRCFVLFLSAQVCSHISASQTLAKNPMLVTSRSDRANETFPAFANDRANDMLVKQTFFVFSRISSYSPTVMFLPQKGSLLTSLKKTVKTPPPTLVSKADMEKCFADQANISYMYLYRKPRRHWKYLIQ